MGKAKAAAPAAPADEVAEPSFADFWDSLEPGSRLSKGVYSVYKTPEGGLHIAYRRDGDTEDSHLPVPAPMVAMMVAASEGKGPLGRMRALVTARMGGA